MKIPTTTKAVISLASAAALIGSTQAALITGLSIADSDGSVPNSNMTALDAIDGTGLSSPISFTSTHSTTWSDHWYSSLVAGAFFTVDLGTNYALDTIHIWNENEDNAGNLRGLQRARISVSSDGNIANLVALATDGTGSMDDGSGDFLFSIAPKDSNYMGFSLDLSGLTNASLLDDVRLVKIETITNYGSGGGSGLAEIQFGGAPIPEPTAALMLTLSLGGLFLRRRRA